MEWQKLNFKEKKNKYKTDLPEKSPFFKIDASNVENIFNFCDDKGIKIQFLTDSNSIRVGIIYRFGCSEKLLEDF